jgi:TRAP transporter 4TM/12TM fusion protein
MPAGKEPQAARYRRLAGWPRWAVVVLCSAGILISLNQIFFILSRYGVSLYELDYYYALYAAFLPLVFLLFPASKKARKDVVPWYDILCFALSFGSLLYFSINGFTITTLGWCLAAPVLPTVIGAILLVLLLEAVRRAVGLIFASLCLFSSFFPMIAPHLPPPFTGLGYSFLQTIRLDSMGSEHLMGIPVRVLGDLLIGFMIFGTAMVVTGGGRFFLDFSLALVGRTRGGPAKVAVLASGLFGSLSGSVASNVLTTGCATIPAMKKLGYPSHYAAAVEACSSTGGVLMPPIMGAAAFVMAMIVGVPYLDIAIAAVIPSVLYFAALLIQVDAYAAKMGIVGMPREVLPSMKQSLKEGWFYLFAFFLLIWFVAYRRLEAQAPFYGAAALLILTMLRKDTRLNLNGFLRFIESTAATLAELSVVMAGVSLLMGALTVTGVASAFASEAIALAGGNLYFLLALSAFTSLLLGTGMTTVACYIFLALMVAPTLIQLGLNVLAVHLFILYYGMLSFITPPVCIGAYVAASVAGSSPMKTGLYATRLGMITYFVPFFFVLNPALVLQGNSLGATCYVFATALVGVALICGALEGYLVGVGRLGWIMRLGAFVSGFLLASPEGTTDVFGAVIAAIMVSVSLIRRKSALSSDRQTESSRIDILKIP